MADQSAALDQLDEINEADARDRAARQNPRFSDNEIQAAHDAVSEMFYRTADAARQGFLAAYDTNPDEFAQTRRAAFALNLPPLLAPNDNDRVKRLAAARGIDFDKIASFNPVLANMLADPELARIMHDDLQPLSAAERLLRIQETLTDNAVTRSARNLTAGTTFDLSSGFYGALETGSALAAPLLDPLVGTLLPENPLSRAAAGFGQWRREQAAMAGNVAGDLSDAGLFERGVYSGFRSFGSMAPGLAATMGTGNPAFALGSAGALAGSQAATRALDAGKSPSEALLYGAQDAVAEIVTEMIPLYRVLGDVKMGAPFWKILGGQIATQVPTEMAATAWQSFNAWGNLNPDTPFSDYLRALPEEEAQTIIATITMSTLMAGMGSVAGRGQRRAARAEQDATRLGQLMDAAHSSRLLQRDPETFEQFVEQAAEDGPVTHVYIDGQTLMQSGVAEQVAAASPAVAAQLQQAAASGGQVSIPVEEYMARIAPTEYSQQLLDHLKTDPDSFSRTEAQAYMQSEAAQSLQDSIERAARTTQEREALREQADRVKALVLADMNAMGRWSPQVNEAYSTLFSAYYTTRAAQLGVTPEEFYARQRVNFASESLATEQFEQRERTTIAAETARWHKAIQNAKSSKSGGFQLKLGVPTVIRSLGSRAGELRVTAAHVEHATDKHPDVPREVWRNLPEMIARPQYAFRNGKNESWNIVPQTKSTAGEHVVIAFDEQGTLSTVYVLNNDETGNSDERLATMLAAAMRSNDRIYAENGLPEGIRARVKTLTPTPARLQANSVRTFSRTPAKVVTRGGLVNRFGDDFYQSAEKDALSQAFEETAQAYGGEAAYSQAKEAGRTKLNYRQWVQVRTPQFKEWFGDWENDPDNASKVVDKETGEPRVVYHGMPYDNPFYTFRKDMMGTQTGAKSSQMGFFAAGKRETSENYAKIQYFEYSQEEKEALYDAYDKARNSYNSTVDAWAKVALRAKNQVRAKSSILREKYTRALRYGSDREIEDAIREKDYHLELKSLEEDLDPSEPDRYYGGVISRYAKLMRGVGDYQSMSRDLNAAWERVKTAKKEIDIQQDALNDYSDDQGQVSVRSGKIHDLFLNIRNPLRHDFEGETYRDVTYAELLSRAHHSGNDGAIFENTYDGGPEDDIFVFFDSNQAKSTTGNTGAFSASEDNILLQGEGARGAFNPETLTITLLQGADLSTALHEGAHFFFETDITLALDVLTRDTPPTAGEQALLDQVSTLLAHHGIEGDIRAQLGQWEKLSFEQKRPIHEATAEMFERYLFSGNAPSIELQSYFRKFRAWLLNVYRSIRDFIVGHPDAGALNPEVRAVFDRMLASEEEIARAQAARSMLPLFATAEQMGVSPEEFSQYQALYDDATAAAVEELQARGLRDMKWLRNARSKVLKALQKEARDVRKATHAELEREVMARPVYRAWQFLKTGEFTRDGERTKLPGGYKLDLATLKALYPAGELAPVDISPLTRYRLAGNGGLHPDVVADLIRDEAGNPLFSSGDEMVRALVSATPPSEAIAVETDARMLEEHGDLVTPEALELAADEAVHNAARMRFAAAEANALAEALGGRKILLAAAREFAARTIDRLRVRDLKPAQYARAAERAGANAERARHCRHEIYVIL
jgi:hypothetical protein